jgi:putative nucleotidyltransferase with HDIG domain
MQRDAVLVVDDDRLVLEQMSDTLGGAGYRTSCFRDPRAALRALEAEQPSVIVSDYTMPHMDGVAFLSRARARAPRAARVLCTSANDFGVALAAVNSGGVYRIIAKPWRPDDLLGTVADAAGRAVLSADNERLVTALRQHSDRLLEMNGQLQHMVRERTDNLLEGLIAALDCRDSDTQWHSRRVSRYARRLAAELGVRGVDLTVIEQGALLHDVGKIGIRDEVLRKPAALTDPEWVEMREHASLGWSLLRSVEYLREAATIVLQHHERWDGKGYPAGLGGEDIDLGARIFHIADALDAMTSDRPYRKARPLEDARREIASLAGSHFDPRLVRAFLAISPDEWERIRIDVETVAILSAELLVARSAQPEVVAAPASAPVLERRAPALELSRLTPFQLSKLRLGELLIELRVIDEEQLASALEYQRWHRCKLGVALADLGCAPEDQIVALLARKLGFERAQLDALQPTASYEAALRLVPETFASAHGIVPVACDRTTLTVAMRDPTNLPIVDELGFRTGRRIKVLLAGEGEVARAVTRLYHRGPSLELDESSDSEPPMLERRGYERSESWGGDGLD